MSARGASNSRSGAPSRSVSTPTASSSVGSAMTTSIRSPARRNGSAPEPARHVLRQPAGDRPVALDPLQVDDLHPQLLGEELHEVVLADEAQLDEYLADRRAGGRLAGQRVVQLGLDEEAPRQQQVAEEAPGVARPDDPDRQRPRVAPAGSRPAPPTAPR